MAQISYLARFSIGRTTLRQFFLILLVVLLSASQALAADITISGDLTITSGTFDADGDNTTVTGVTTISGCTNLPLLFTGGNNQSITVTSGSIMKSLNINKSGGRASLLSNYTSTGGKEFRITAGTLFLNGGTLTCSGPFTIMGSGELQLIGSEAMPTTPVLDSGSTVTYLGDGDGAADVYTTINLPYSNLKVSMIDVAETLRD